MLERRMGNWSILSPNFRYAMQLRDMLDEVFRL